MQIENEKPQMEAVTSEPKPSVPAIKKLTPNEARERREKGLCAIIVMSVTRLITVAKPKNYFGLKGCYKKEMMMGCY